MMPIAWAELVFGTPSGMSVCVALILTGLLMTAVWTDLSRLKIANSLIVSGVLIALLLHVFLPAGNGFFANLPGGQGVLISVAGMVCGLLAMLPFYVWLGLGAGDAKLMAVVGAFLGPVHIWPVVLFTGVAGGLLALILMFKRPAKSSRRLPYAPAIAMGCITYLGIQVGYL